MVAKNDITGDNIQTRSISQAYLDNYDRTLGDKSVDKEKKQKEKEEYFAKLNAETKMKLQQNKQGL